MLMNHFINWPAGIGHNVESSTFNNAKFAQIDDRGFNFYFLLHHRAPTEFASS